jgi:Fe-S-cluster containining protein
MSEEAASSLLCLECGLCCQGILHGSVKIRSDEVPAVRRLGLPIVETEEGPTFPQPCLCYRNDRCTVYAERPSACRAFRCKLLKAYEAGAVSWDESMRQVRQARELVASLHRRLGPESVTTGLWPRLQGEEGLATAPDNSGLLLDVASLLVISQTHFHDRAQPVETFGR